MSRSPCCCACGGIAAVYLRRLPGVIFAAQLAMWSAATLVRESFAGGVHPGRSRWSLAVLVSRDQQREQRLRGRATARARPMRRPARATFSADYEETRQGWFWKPTAASQLTYISRAGRRGARPVAGAADRPAAGRAVRSRLTGQRRRAHADVPFFRPIGVSRSCRCARRSPARSAGGRSAAGRSTTSMDNFVGFRGSGTDLTAEAAQPGAGSSRLAHYDRSPGSPTGSRCRRRWTRSSPRRTRRTANARCCCSTSTASSSVNDTMGHPAGDALLRQVAQRLERAAGRASAGQVGRLGGDEFKVIVPGRIERARISASSTIEIIHALSQPYSIDGQRVVIGASVGIALSPDDGARPARS